jgi:hypothetical protein
MIVFESPAPLAWGELDLPVSGISRDWTGAEISPAPLFSLAMDRERLWFVAGHARPAALHPRARPGAFQAELWKHDVAELFLADPAGGRYLEINLAPNGAWWSCEFTAPRVRAEETDIFLPDVATFADLAADGSWLAAIALPLDVLRARLGFGPTTRANATFLLGSPEQRFFSANDLGGGEPDFHIPQRFSPLRFTALPPRE